MPRQVQQLSSPGSTDTLITPEMLKVRGTGPLSKPFGYTYDLPALDVVEFQQLHSFVKAVFDEGRQRFKMELATVTNQIAMCPPSHWPYLTKCDCLGVSMQAQGKPEEFHIWINPAYKKPVFKFYMTLTHELVHGYAGLQYGHNSHWRRWFYRTLWHLVEGSMIPMPEDELKYVCCTVEHAYNHTPKLDPMLTILEAFNKAEGEHDKVKANYFRRLG